MTLFFEPKKKASNWKERKKKVSKHYVSNQYRVFLTYQCAETTQLLVTSSSLSQHEKKHFYLRTKILIINCTKHKMNVYYIFIMLLILIRLKIVFFGIKLKYRQKILCSDVMNFGNSILKGTMLTFRSRSCKHEIMFLRTPIC